MFLLIKNSIKRHWPFLNRKYAGGIFFSTIIMVGILLAIFSVSLNRYQEHLSEYYELNQYYTMLILSQMTYGEVKETWLSQQRGEIKGSITYNLGETHYDMTKEKLTIEVVLLPKQLKRKFFYTK
ncbi:competence type IV pilus minor pilin ComGG [Vagococcus humatus]|nr:competence type IV pilus minor pilin ComGG [Vagococcus humatus]